MLAKLTKVRNLGYIRKGPVTSLTAFFAVPKGPTDIRMVYDASISGLNNSLWAPWFPLPTEASHLQAVDPRTFMGDVDAGDHFLNFVLLEKLKQLCSKRVV